MKNLLLFLLLIVMSISTFGQKQIQLTSDDYRIGGLLITENEQPAFVKKLDATKNRYEELIEASKSFSIVEIFQIMETNPNKVVCYFLGDRNFTYNFFTIPFFYFEVIRVDSVLEHNLILKLKPTEPILSNKPQGFTRKFKNVEELSEFISLVVDSGDTNWVDPNFIGDKYYVNYSNITNNNKLIPNHAFTMIKDAPKGKKIIKVKSPIFKKPIPVILLNEGVRYALDEYLKVSYNGIIGWVSIRSFNPQDIYAIRKDIVWMDSKNVNF